MRKIITFVILLALLSTVTGCGFATRPNSRDSEQNGSEAAQNTNPPSSSNPSSNNQGSQSQQSPPSSAPSQSEPEKQESVPPAPSNPSANTEQPNNNPGGSSANPGGNVGTAGQRYIDTPREDTFMLLRTFEVGGIVNPNEIHSIDITLSTSGTININDDSGIKSVWDAMSTTQVTQEGAFDANPSTGGKVTLTFYFTDNTKATIDMSGLVFFNTTNGPFIFTEGHSEQPFIQIYNSYVR